MVRRSRNKMCVVCYKGETTVVSGRMQVIYAYKRWIVRVNPALLPPAWRREHVKTILINGKLRGQASMRRGCIPLRRFEIKGDGFQVWLQRVIMRYLGYGPSRYLTSYIYIELCGLSYAVTTDVTEAGFTLCEVYSIDEQQAIGRFNFTSDFSEVYANTFTEGVSQTLQVILGYVADVVVYSSAANSLDRAINIYLNR